MIARFIQIFKTASGSLLTRQMDFYRGSIPPNFISFCLDRQNLDDSHTPTNPASANPTEVISSMNSVPIPGTTRNLVPSPPPFPPLVSSSQITRILPPLVGPSVESQGLNSNSQSSERSGQDQVAEVISPHSVDSNIDVTAYADEMVEHMQKTQLSNEIVEEIVEVRREGAVKASHGTELSADMPITRSSTPIPHASCTVPTVSLSQLESGLEIAGPPDATLPQLLPVEGVPNETSKVSFLQQDEDNSSSVHDAPPLPGTVTATTYVSDYGELDQLNESSDQQIDLYGYRDTLRSMDSVAEETQESDFGIQDPQVPGTSSSQLGATGPKLHNLSGRSRATLKQYFGEAKPITLPQGRPVITLTEPQLYHLLRVLTNETVSLSYNTMEHMVVSAVKGAPATSKSRTDQFKTFRRAQTPYPSSKGDSGSEGCTTPVRYDSLTDAEMSGGTESGDTSFHEESDSAGELALIEQNFARAGTSMLKDPSEVPGPSSRSLENPHTSDANCLDETLSQVRDHAIAEKTHTGSKKKQPQKKKRVKRRGVPMREEFFSKIGWTRSFISGPADPLHNSHMVWCHICKKNFSIRSKGPEEILRHHRTEKHLRKDQRWRYEYLKSVDPVTGKVQHRVRGRDGRILNRLALAKEMPRFIHAELVDIGERFPFYDDFIKGRTDPLVTPDSRARTQL